MNNINNYLSVGYKNVKIVQLLVQLKNKGNKNINNIIKFYKGYKINYYNFNVKLKKKYINKVNKVQQQLFLLLFKLIMLKMQ